MKVITLTEAIEMMYELRDEDRLVFSKKEDLVFSKTEEALWNIMFLYITKFSF